MAAQIRGHHTRHIGIDQLRGLKNLHSIFTDAAATNVTDTPQCLTGEAAVEVPKSPERCQNGGATYNDSAATSNTPGIPQV